MIDILLPAVGGLCAAGGFLAGVIYTGRRVPHMLAQATPDEALAVARHAGRIRRTTTGPGPGAA